MRRMILLSPLLFTMMLFPAPLQGGLSCHLPTGDATLMSLELEVGGLDRVDSFDSAVREYDLWFAVPSSVTLRAVATDPRSNIRVHVSEDLGQIGIGSGEVTFDVLSGFTEITVLVFASGGTSRSYILYVDPTAPATWTVCGSGCDFGSIQGAIDDARHGDTVLVGPGTYIEHVDFLGKAITVQSTSGPSSTTIDGADDGTVVHFSRETNGGALLEGFAITGGTSVSGGGIHIAYAAPVIRGNEIANNVACSGAGIYSYFGAPVIEDNVIRENYDGGCTGNDGGGIHIGGTTIPAAVLSGNKIFDNESYFGGGIGVTTAEGTTIRDNEISGNVARSSGGGVYIGGNFDRVFVVQNLIFDNTAARGGGIHWERGNPQVLQNTIADNDSSSGSGVFAEQQNYETRIVNNVIVANPGQVAVFCNGFTGDGKFFHNDVFAPGGGSAYGFLCNDQTGITGNVSMDPDFEDSTQSNYDLDASSPLVDAGEASTTDLPDVDIAERPRVVDGDGDQTAIVDMGAYERQP